MRLRRCSAAPRGGGAAVISLITSCDPQRLYLLPSLNLKLRPRLWSELRAGTRVVSNAFSMGDDWPPERTETIDSSTIYFWTIKPR